MESWDGIVEDAEKKTEVEADKPEQEADWLDADKACTVCGETCEACQ